jgi:glycerol-3-phosphate O-acyltransferase
MRDGLSLKERFGHRFAEFARYSRAAGVIDETNVYQEANQETRRIMNEIVGEILLPGSRLEGREHFAALRREMQGGRRMLLLMEHYSNMDLPVLCYLLDHDGGDFGAAISRGLVAIAGMKLNEVNPMVKAWAESYTRIVICPSRSLADGADPEEEARGRKINMAAMRALDAAKRRGQPVLVFPSGTRYRPGKPETKRGLREIDSYLRSFDAMILVSMNGRCLRMSESEPDNMIADQVFPDRIIIAASPVTDCKAFRDGVAASVAGTEGADHKQAAADRIMELLAAQHDAYEKLR